MKTLRNLCKWDRDDFIKLAFVKQSPGCQMVSCVQTQTTREIEIEKFITHRSWRKYTACLEGPPREVKTGYRQGEGQDAGHMTLLGSMGRVFGGFQAKTRLVNSNTKKQSFGKPHGGLI